MKKNFEKILPYLNIDKLKENKQAIVFLVCVLIATALWFLNALGKDYSTTISYPVRYVSAPNRQFLSNEPPSKLELKVDAHGFTLLRHKLSMSFSPIILNLGNITKNTEPKDGTYTIPSANLLRRVRSQVSNEISVREIHPEVLVIELDSLKSKTVPVRADIHINFKPQFNLKTPVTLTPNMVKITGPAHTIDTINYLFTKAGTFEELDNPVSKNLDVLYPGKTTIVPEKVQITIDVEKFTEKEIMVPVQLKNKPANVKLKLFPSVIKISCLVGLSEFENITSNDFKAVVNYETIDKEKSTLPVEIEYSPSFVELIRYTPESVEYLVETN